MRNRKGFTLVEVIVAVAALAIASVFVMRMVVVSDTLKKRSILRSKTLDAANHIAESLKTSNDYEDFLLTLPLAELVLQDIKEHSTAPFGLTCYYNRHGYPVEDEDQAQAKLDITVKLLEDQESGRLYAVGLTSSALEKGTYRELFSYDVVHYYPALGEGVTSCEP